MRRLYYGLVQTTTITYLVVFAYVWHFPVDPTTALRWTLLVP
jgi:hypothetical protein